MNKTALIEVIHKELGGTKTQAEGIVDLLFSTIVKEVAAGNEVSVSGFGIFEAKHRAARMGRNPKTGEAIQIKASISPKFRASKAFKDSVNN